MKFMLKTACLAITSMALVGLAGCQEDNEANVPQNDGKASSVDPKAPTSYEAQAPKGPPAAPPTGATISAPTGPAPTAPASSGDQGKAEDKSK